MIERFIAGQMLRFGYRIRSLATNQRQFRIAVTEIEKLVAATPEPILRGRGTFLHPFFGRLDSRGAYALLAFHLRLHVPHVRRSIEANRRS